MHGRPGCYTSWPSYAADAALVVISSSQSVETLRLNVKQRLGLPPPIFASSWLNCSDEKISSSIKYKFNKVFFSALQDAPNTKEAINAKFIF